jgi:hypothetical protein
MPRYLGLAAEHCHHAWCPTARRRIIGAAVTGIVYLASNGQSKEAHALDVRIAKLEWQSECLRNPASCLPREHSWSRPLAAQ